MFDIKTAYCVSGSSSSSSKGWGRVSLLRRDIIEELVVQFPEAYLMLHTTEISILQRMFSGIGANFGKGLFPYFSIDIHDLMPTESKSPPRWNRQVSQNAVASVFSPRGAASENAGEKTPRATTESDDDDDDSSVEAVDEMFRGDVIMVTGPS